MPRAVPRAMAVLLVIVVAAQGPSARGQALVRPMQGNQMPMREALAEENAGLSEERLRIEEFKVELALLADIDLFPYSVGANARGEYLELFGFVPDQIIRKHAVDVARRHTILKVSNAIGIRSDVSQRPTIRPAHVLQQEAAELLRTKMREEAKQVTVAVRANGVLALTGRTPTLESKLEVSRLLRQFSGCTGLDNQLTVEQIVRSGQRMVQVTRDGSLLVPPSVLGLKAEPLIAAASPDKLELASFPQKEAFAPAGGMQPSTLPPPTALPNNGLGAKEGELRLPTAVLPKRPNPLPNTSTIKNGNDGDALAPAKLPVKWGRPNVSWETQAKQLEAAHKRPVAVPQATPEQPKLPPGDIARGGVAEPKWTPISPAETKINRVSTNSQAIFAETRTTPAPEMTWRRPGGGEASEQRGPTGTTSADALSKSLPPQAPLGPPLQSSRRWPPAYITGPKPSEGRPGLIIFGDEPKPAKPMPAPVATSRRIVPAELQRQVKSLCGRQASDVSIAIQQDGSVLVKVRVPNRSIEDELSRKILAIPDMTSPRVRLLMDVER